MGTRFVPPPVPGPTDPGLCFPESVWASGRTIITDPKRRAYYEPIMGHQYDGTATCGARAGTGIDPIPPVDDVPPYGGILRGIQAPYGGILRGIEGRTSHTVLHCPRRPVQPYTAGKSILGGN